jgi:general secretion pathway protein B
MSYILDALRKAERERGMNQVPTLMTDHALRHPNQNQIWIGLGIVLLGVAVIAGWHFSHERETGTAGSKPGIELNNPDSGAKDNAAEMPADGDERATTPPTALTPSEKPTAAVAPRGAATVIPRDAVREQANARRLQASLPDDEDVSDEEDTQSLPPNELLTGLPRPNIPSAALEAAKSQPTSLQEAVSRMTLSLLMYSESKEERMVFIDGTKYHEGEYIDGVFLLERITEDGALLSFEGERALLQPKSK